MIYTLCIYVQSSCVLVCGHVGYIYEEDCGPLQAHHLPHQVPLPYLSSLGGPQSTGACEGPFGRCALLNPPTFCIFASPASPPSRHVSLAASLLATMGGTSPRPRHRLRHWWRIPLWEGHNRQCGAAGARPCPQWGVLHCKCVLCAGTCVPSGRCTKLRDAGTRVPAFCTRVQVVCSPVLPTLYIVPCRGNACTRILYPLVPHVPQHCFVSLGEVLRNVARYMGCQDAGADSEDEGADAEDEEAV